MRVKAKELGVAPERRGVDDRRLRISSWPSWLLGFLAHVEHPPEIVDPFQKANVGKKTVVNVILLKSREDPALVKLLQTIADQNGGRLKIVEEKDF